MVSSVFSAALPRDILPTGWQLNRNVDPLPAVAIDKNGRSEFLKPRPKRVIRGNGTAYELHHSLGKGGFGEVFEARELGVESAEWMACKIVDALDRGGKQLRRPDPKSRMLRDVEAMKVLMSRIDMMENELDIWLDVANHPHIMGLRHWFRIGEHQIAFFMSLATAKTLADYPVDELPVTQALVLLVQIMDAAIVSVVCIRRS
ncbi:hypothetical protein FRB94_002215 [Tulasnella sp. JGI-2019a]|nr:hypothetical protein FRB94_002215 [Tulasnella sp. JGI-2019a]